MITKKATEQFSLLPEGKQKFSAFKNCSLMSFSNFEVNRLSIIDRYLSYQFYEIAIWWTVIFKCTTFTQHVIKYDKKKLLSEMFSLIFLY